MIVTIIIDNTYYHPQLTRCFFLSTEAWSGAWLGPHCEFFSELGSLNESVTSSPFILELSSAASPTRHWILPNQHGGKSVGLGDRPSESGPGSGPGSFTRLCCALTPSTSLPETLVFLAAKWGSKQNLPPWVAWGIQGHGADRSSCMWKWQLSSRAV